MLAVALVSAATNQYSMKPVTIHAQMGVAQCIVLLAIHNLGEEVWTSHFVIITDKILAVIVQALVICLKPDAHCRNQMFSSQLVYCRT